MCVIIKRDPHIIIPEEKIISACHVNPDGFGYSIVRDGQMETVKVCADNGNEEKEVLKLLEDSKDSLLFLHLRYTTAGKTNEDNCHPFEVFKGDNFEVQFMHNGTMSKFTKTDSDYSDTYHFTQEILKPLIRAFYEVDGAGVLLNPTVKTIISEFKGASAFMLYDNEGNHLAIENTSCKQFEGWWASNEYSFNRTHRDPPKSNTTYYYGKKPYANHAEDYYSDRWPKTTTPTQSTPTATKTPATTPTVVTDKTKEDSKKVGYAIMQAKRHGALPKALTAPEDRLTFREMAELSDLKDIMVMTEGDLYDLIEETPLAALALMMDLIHELYVKQVNTTFAATHPAVTQLKAAS